MHWWSEGDEICYEGIVNFGGSGGYDISSSTSESSSRRDDFEVITKPTPAPAPVKPTKPPVQIGSLPKIPAIVWHVVLAIAAAVLVHLAIYFYGR